MKVPGIYLFTDFGSRGPYMGLMEAAAVAVCPRLRVSTLMSDALATDPRRSAYLLAALMRWLPADAVVVAVVDPGVGGDRRLLALRTQGRWCLGPDNGLLSRLAAADEESRLWELPSPSGRQISASFHGRDILAPAAARLACGQPPDLIPARRQDMLGMDWPEMLAEVIYLDDFGNAMSGIPAAAVSDHRTLICEGRMLPRVRTFSDVSPGELLCYENSLGLLEIAANGGSAAQILGLKTGSILSLSGESS